MKNHPLSKLSNYQIILASKSPRRKELLESLDINFNVEVRNVEESYPNDLPVEEIPEYLANLKASAFPSQFMPDRQMVITADTIVVKDGKVLEKPKDTEEAAQMLKELSSSGHKVISGVCIKTNSFEKSFSSESTVRFSEITSNEIDYYLHKYKPFDKAGAYGIQEWIGMVGIDFIKGSFYNVMGLPTHLIYKELLKFCDND